VHVVTAALGRRRTLLTIEAPAHRGGRRGRSIQPAREVFHACISHVRRRVALDHGVFVRSTDRATSHRADIGRAERQRR
jgi:hypothetical protein